MVCDTVLSRFVFAINEESKMALRAAQSNAGVILVVTVDDELMLNVLRCQLTY